MWNCTPCFDMGGGQLWGGSSSGLLMVEGGGVMQKLIPNVRQLEFAYILVERWIIYPDEHSLIDSPGNAVCLTTHNGETVHTDAMSCGVAMFVYGGGSPKMLLKPVLKGPS